MIFNIQRYSTHDGPGIRTVIFMKGCSLACRWCQNPESRSLKQDLLYDARQCIAGCRLCEEAAPDIIHRADDGLTIHRDKLTLLHFTQLQNCCPAQALQVCGETMEIDQIMAIICRDRPFYQRSGGGVTLSGGEPFMQPEMTRQLLTACYNAGIHTAVETCLHVPWSAIADGLPYIDLFLADLKHLEPLIFKQWTHGSARLIIKNLQRLTDEGKSIVIRVPLIPDFNAQPDSLRRIIDFVADQLHLTDIHFLPYHTLGMNKYQLLQQPYLAANKPLNAPELLDFAIDYAEAKGLNVTLRG